MKTFAIVLVIGFALQVSNAFEPVNVETCLVENGFTKNEDDVALIECIGKPEGVDKLKNVPKEKLAAALACMYHKEYKESTLYDVLKLLTEMDDKVTEDQKQQMKDTLTTCVQEAKGNDPELLNCMKAVDSPFDTIIATLRDLDEQYINYCFPACEVKISDLYTLKTAVKKIDEVLKHVPQEKFNCITACRVYYKDDPKQFIYNMITDMIEKSVLSEDKKTEITGILKKCYTEEGYKKEEMASVLEKSIEKKTKLSETYQLLKCVKYMEAPFIEFIRS